MAPSPRGISKSLLPSARSRATIAKRLSAVTGAMTTATIAEMEARHQWFRRLDAEPRSQITLVAQAGIDGFVKWFADPDGRNPSTSDVFSSAPRELTRKISLHQTVELVRTTIDVVEAQIDEVMPKGDRPVLHAAIVQYSREVAFAAAEIYARAAELRGAWDARLEALVVDAVLRGDADETVLSRAATLGWRSAATVVVVVGAAPELDPALALEAIRHASVIAGADMLGAVQGDRLRQIAVLGGHSHRIAKALERLRKDFDRPLRIEDIARELGMSVSGFHHHFKAVTAMSPLQFQKRMRLQEARHLMLAEDIDAASAGYRVGYSDASHFNREYKTLFGSPPMRDVERLREGARESADL